MRRSTWSLSTGLLLPALSLLFPAPGALRADDAPAPPAPSPAPPPDGEKRDPAADESPRDETPAGLELRIYDVSALVSGAASFRMERGPFPCAPDQVNDEANPLFGGEREEFVKPVGNTDDLVEAIVALDRTVFPHSVNPAGASVRTLGWGRVAVRAPASVHATVAALLADLERRTLRAVTIDVVVLRGDASGAQADGLAAAVGRGTLVPVVGARAVGYPSGTVVARQGADLAYVQDEDVEVAEKSKIPDPIVGVARDGISFQAEIHDATADRVTVELRAWWASTDKVTRVDMQPSGDPVETVEGDGRTADAVLELVPGAWTLLASTGDVVFAVRASVRAHEPPIAASKPLFTTRPFPARGPIARRMLDVHDLLLRARNSRTHPVLLVPSNYTPPEPPELREPMPSFPVDELVSALRQELDADYWQVPGVELDVSNGQVRLSADGPHAAAIAEIVDAARAGAGRSTRFRETVVTLPLASIPEYFAGLDDGATLLADGGKSLLSRAGAQIIDRGGVRCRPMQRVATTGGRSRSYVADYDVEIASDSSIGNPIVRSVLDGSSLDVECRLAAGGAAASVDLRIDRSTWRSSRQVRTGSGDIECPNVGLSRLRGATWIPLGQLRIVGATLEAGVVTLTVLSANAD